MSAFRYQAREAGGAAVSGLIEAESRQRALELLAARGLFPSVLEASGAAPPRSAAQAGSSAQARSAAPPRSAAHGPTRPAEQGRSAANGPSPAASNGPARSNGSELARGPIDISGGAPSALIGGTAPALPAVQPWHAAAAPAGAGKPAASHGRISRKSITAFTRELATLLGATIPIPAALESLGREEENPALRHVLLELSAAVRRGESLSAALEAHPRSFSKLYTSMVRVGEEAGALDKVMADLADLLEHDDEVRGEVWGAMAYPCFVLVLGVVTTFVLLVFILPRLFSMLEGMLDTLPLPTRILLGLSTFFQANWPWVLVGAGAAGWALRAWLRSPAGALRWDTWKLRLPVLGSVFRASALSRFARTLGTLARAGVSLLPALEIVRHTIGNRLLERCLAQAAEETRGGDSLATPLRKIGLFPSAMLQMVAVGEETGRLDEMLLRVAAMEERQMRGRSRALISLLAPALILVVGVTVGFVVIALLLPIFRMSQMVR